MIDIHTHILPGIDDGVQTEDEAVEFARMAVADGVRTMVATPHCKEGSYFNDRSIVVEGVARLRERLAREGVDLELVPGAEVHVCLDLVARIEDGRAPTLADNGKTLLLELPLSQPPPALEDVIFNLKLAGLIVVLAHPERIRYFQDDVRRYEEAVRLGAFGQLTTGSLVGTFGEVAREFSEELAAKGLVHVLASDAHNVRRRNPVLTEAVRELVPLVGDTYASAMVDAIPRALLAGEEPAVPEIEPVRSKTRGSFLSRLFRRN